MATSGQFTIYTLSVDYGGGRGHFYSNMLVNWNLSNTNYLTISEASYDTNESNWWICSSNPTSSAYQLIFQVQFRPTGGDWQVLYDNRVDVKGPCSSYTYQTGTNVKANLETFANNWSGVQLTQAGELRVCYGCTLAPAPSPSYPNAFPDLSYSASSQVPEPIPVIVDYHPGATWSGEWKSHNRSGGASNIYNNGWQEMKTKNGGEEDTDPPSIWHSATTKKNMRKIGSE